VKSALVISFVAGAKLVLSGHVIYSIICISHANIPSLISKELIAKEFFIFLPTEADSLTHQPLRLHGASPDGMASD
jgi:hypothetical protein